jgi:hypothetical protein
LSRAERRERTDPIRDSISSMTKMIPMIDTRVMQETMVDVLESLNEPAFKDDIKKTVELSYTTSLQFAQRLVKLSQALAAGNSNQLSDAIGETLPSMAKATLSMSTELATLNQKYASKMMDALEKGAKKKETRKGA